MAVRGAHLKKHIDAQDKGMLRLARKPTAYKGISDVWIRSIKDFDDWAKYEANEEEEERPRNLRSSVQNANKDVGH